MGAGVLFFVLQAEKMLSGGLKKCIVFIGALLKCNKQITNVTINVIKRRI